MQFSAIEIKVNKLNGINSYIKCITGDNNKKLSQIKCVTYMVVLFTYITNKKLHDKCCLGTEKAK